MITKNKSHIDVFESLYKSQQTYLSLRNDGLTDSDIEYICTVIIENIQRLRILKENETNI